MKVFFVLIRFAFASSNSEKISYFAALKHCPKAPYTNYTDEYYRNIKKPRGYERPA
jgi:hypothetical protein